MRRRFLGVGAALIVAGLGTAVPSAGGQSGSESAVVTAAVQVTGTPSPVRDFTSPLIARNPKTGELVTASVDIRGNRECVVHISTDAGRSWFTGGGMMVKPFTDCSIGAEWGSYFSLFFDSEGVLYMPFAANDPADLTKPRTVVTEDDRDSIARNVYLARSNDSGRSFVTATAYKVPEGKPDAYNKGVVGAIDPNDSSKIYIGWRQGAFSSKTQKLMNQVVASSDGGRTFGPPVDISGPLGADHPTLSVDGKGTVHAVTWTRSFQLPDPVPARPILHFASTDQGKTWTSTQVDPGNQRSYRSPVLVADPKSSALYVVWSGSQTVNNSELEDKDRVDVLFRASYDGGKTWSERKVVNDEPQKGVNHSFPNVSLSPDGRLDIAWYDGRLSTRPAGDPEGDSGFTDIFYASSTDGGRSFTPNMRISDRSADRSIGAWANNVGSAGPVGIASTADGAFFTWQDTRNGDSVNQAEDVYMASVGLEGRPLETARSVSKGINRTVIFLAGGALGMGIAMVVASLLGGRQQT